MTKPLTERLRTKAKACRMCGLVKDADLFDDTAKALEEARIALQGVHDVTIDTVAYGIAREWLTAHPEARESQPEAKRVPSSPRSN